MRRARVAVLFVSVAFASIGAGAEIPVDLPAYGPAPRSQRSAAVASDGEQYLVVWNDERTEAHQRHATRVSGSGDVLDPNGIRIRSLSARPVHVVWAGSAWFVVSEGEWDYERDGYASPELTRIDRSGRVLDPEPRTLPILPETNITVATDGRHVVIGYDRGRVSYEKRALVLDAEGEAMAEFPLSPAGAPTKSGPPAIGSNGAVFAALWLSGAQAASFGAETIEGVPFGLNGPLGPSRVVFGSSSQTPPQMASDGRNFMVIQDRGVYRMTADLVAEFHSGDAFESAQAIVWTGSEYAIVFRTSSSDAREAKVVRLDRDGQPAGQQAMRLQGSADDISSRVAASNGESLLLAWHDATEEKPTTIQTFTDTYAAMVSLPELALGPRRLLSVSAKQQLRPVTASSALHHLTVWQEAGELYARRHRRDGGADGPPLRLSGGASSAAVVFNGTDFLVASTEGREVVTRRLPSSGALRVEGEGRLDGGSRPWRIALASSGAVTLVSWLDNYGYNGHGGIVYVARAGAGGAFVDREPLQLAPEELAYTVQKIDVAANDRGEFLVLWGGTNPFCPCSPVMLPTSDPLRAARVTSSRTLLDVSPIEVVVPDADVYIDHPSVTWNGSEWLVVWNRGSSAEDWTVREEIRGRRIAREGTLLDGPARDPGILIARDAFAPTVAWTGSGYLLGWYEGLPNHRDRMGISAYPLLRIRTASFDRLGAPLTEVRTIGESKWADPVSFSVVNGVASRAYARIADEPQYGGISRAFLEVATTPATPRRRTARH